jgi:AcrR family transcriptional regulator
MPPSAAPHGGPELPASRDRILDAAEELFAQHGLAGAGVREIAQAAGLTPASLYNHFPSKEALYAAVLERGVRPLLELLRQLSARSHPADAMEEIVGAIMEHLARTPDLPRLVQHEACDGGEHLAGLAWQWIQPLIAQGVAEMRRDPDSPWEEAEFPLIITAWLHLVFGYFAMAPLLSEVFKEDLLSQQAIERQTRFFRKLARLMMRSPRSGGRV